MIRYDRSTCCTTKADKRTEKVQDQIPFLQHFRTTVVRRSSLACHVHVPPASASSDLVPVEAGARLNLVSSSLKVLTLGILSHQLNGSFLACAAPLLSLVDSTSRPMKEKGSSYARTNDTGLPSMGSRPPSPYHDLHLWNPEENLIELDASPNPRPSDSRGSVRRQMSSEGGEPRGNPIR